MIPSIIKKLKAYNHAYRTGESIVSDAEYDALLEELRKLSPEHPYLTRVEPTPTPDDRKEKLPMIMRSLNKLKSFEEFQAWVNKNRISEDAEVYTLPKLDGISLLEDEFNGCAWTRGSEDNIGMRSDKHIQYMNNGICTKFHYSGGEAIITNENWKEHFEGKRNPASGEIFKTKRGTVAGIFASDADKFKDFLPFVSYIRYNAFVGESDAMYTYDIFELNNINPVQIPAHCCKIKDLTSDKLNELYFRWNSLFDCDGLVICLNDKREWKRLGRHATSGNPLYSVAYKADFEQRFQTKCVAVNARVSKNGYLRPTVEIEPVMIDGAKIDNPTGNNFKFVYDNNIAPGTELTVIRSGSVIPKIVGFGNFNGDAVVSLMDKFALCPACESSTKWNETMTDLVCCHRYCPGKELAKIIYFFSVLEFEDFGETTIETVYNYLKETNSTALLTDFLNLETRKLTPIPGIGKSIANSINDQLNGLYNNPTSLVTLMKALDTFEGIGDSKGQLIIDNFSDDMIEKLIAHTADVRDVSDELNCVKGLGEKTVQSFINGWGSFTSLLKNTQLPFKICKTETSKSVKYKGLSVCFSGVRDSELEKILSSNGGVIVSNVSKKTTHLVTLDPEGASGKIVKAKELGTTIISLADAKNLWN